MVSGLSISHTQIGILSSAYAGSKMLMYIPCGIFADRINTKRVLVFSLVGESILTAIYATLPAMPILIGVQVMFAFVNIFFWTSFIKSIRILGKNREQGKIFGLSEGLRGITGSLATFLGLHIINLFAMKQHSLCYVLWFYAAYYMVVGILVWRIYPDQMETEEERCQQWSDYVEVFRKPAVWMVSLLIITSYSLQVAFEYTTSYMTQVLGITAMFAGVVATLRDNNLRADWIATGWSLGR